MTDLEIARLLKPTPQPQCKYLYPMLVLEAVFAFCFLAAGAYIAVNVLFFDRDFVMPTGWAAVVLMLFGPQLLLLAVAFFMRARGLDFDL